MAQNKYDRIHLNGTHNTLAFVNKYKQNNVYTLFVSNATNVCIDINKQFHELFACRWYSSFE